MQDIKETVSNFYGETVQKTEDLEYAACCIDDYDAALVENLTDEVRERRYGCGSPLPDLLAGQTVVDLGSGAGADCFMAAQLVGRDGRVIGIDMTDEQLEVARRNIEPHMSRFGFEQPNVEFEKGLIEDVPLPDDSADVVISNCVINLSDDKESVFAEIRRILREGGEFFISDIVADRRVPDHLKEDEQLWSECLSGAAYAEDLRRMMHSAGFRDVRTVESSPTGDVIEGIKFRSVILRGFNLDLEDRCEDYGQVAVYRGTVPGADEGFTFDDHHYFPAGEAVRVCRNTAVMLSESRLRDHFRVSEPLEHLGLFDCAPTIDETATTDPRSETTAETSSCC